MKMTKIITDLRSIWIVSTLDVNIGICFMLKQENLFSVDSFKRIAKSTYNI